MEYSKSFRLGLRPEDIPQVISVKQYDLFTRFLSIQLTRDGVNYSPESGVAFLFRCRRPDGSVVIKDSAEPDAALGRTLVIHQGGGIIQIELDDEITDVPGRCLCDLCMTKNEQILSTDLFVLDVVASPDVSELYL